MASEYDIEAKAGLDGQAWCPEDDQADTLKACSPSVRGADEPPSPTTTATRASLLSWKLGSWFATRTPPEGENEVEKLEYGQKPEVLKLRDCPRGYPRLAAFLDSDDNFMIYRRFGYIQARLLLEKQNELQQLEKQLKARDVEDDSETPGCLNRADTKATPSERTKFMWKLSDKYHEYAALVDAAKSLTATPQPTKSAYASLKNYVDHTAPLCQKDLPWVACEEDMITLRPGRERAWLDDIIEHILQFLNCRWINNLFISSQTREKTEGLALQQTEEGLDPSRKHFCPTYYTRSRIDRLVTGIITLSILVLLVSPIYILYHVSTAAEKPNSTAVCIGTLLVFTLAFSAVASFFTKARRHEILAAAAAYCAVLVVFLGNFQPSAHS